MTINSIAFVLLLLAVTAAVLGGLGVGGLGRDSRGLDTRRRPEDPSSRPLVS